MPAAPQEHLDAGGRVKKTGEKAPETHHGKIMSWNRLGNRKNQLAGQNRSIGGGGNQSRTLQDNSVQMGSGGLKGGREGGGANR